MKKIKIINCTIFILDFRFLTIFEKVFLFLSKFCRKNSINKKELYTKIEIF
jgi:hypothetical protein